MQLFSWLRKRRTDGPQTRRAPARKPTPRFRPQLEALEDRWVPSTLTVTNNLDSGAGSLRAEVAAAQPNDTLVFAPTLAGQTIKLTSGELFINKNLTIQGLGPGQLAISGGNASRVFEVRGANTNVTLSGLTITQGNAFAKNGNFNGMGGGILNDNGSTLTISNCTLSGNHAAFYGGGIDNFNATLKIVNSTVSANKVADGNGGGKGGGVYSIGGSTVTMTDCTLSNNVAGFEGGGVWIYSTTMTVNGCTLSGNVAYGGAGAGVRPTSNDIYNGNTGSDPLTVSDSVFSNNTPYRFFPIEGPWINGGGNTGA